MGTDGWDDDSWRRGGTPRNRRASDEGSPERSYGRGLRESARSADGWNPPRNSRNDASGQGSRYGRRPGGGDDGSSSGYGGRGRPAGPGGSARGGSRAPREDHDDDYRSRGRGAAPPDRSGRARPAPRPDAWDAPQQRGRRPAGPGGPGGQWDDDGRPRHVRPGVSDPSGRMPGRYDPRDPRARRPGQAAAKKSGGISFSTSFGVIVLMFLIGAAAAFGVFTLTKPTVKAETLPGATPTVPSTVSPTVSPTAPKATPTKTGSTSGGHSVVVLVRAFSEL
jgi:hypothetical protein